MNKNLWVALSVCFACLSGQVLTAQSVTPLAFEPSAPADYSSALDRIILLSSGPNKLHIYDPASNSDQTVDLAEVPIAVSVGPDGTHAAVSFTDGVAYVNLQTRLVEKTFSVATGIAGGIVLGPQYLYVVNSPTATYSSGGVSISLATGTQTTFNVVYWIHWWQVQSSDPSHIWNSRWRSRWH